MIKNSLVLLDSTELLQEELHWQQVALLAKQVKLASSFLLLFSQVVKQVIIVRLVLFQLHHVLWLKEERDVQKVTIVLLEVQLPFHVQQESIVQMMDFQNPQDLVRLDIFVQEEPSLKILKQEPLGIFAQQDITAQRGLHLPLLALSVLFEMLWVELL